MPHAAYWQQDVYYRIEAHVDELTHCISGKLWLTYWNNSPDTLRVAYFHLYQQAFVKGGHLEALNLANHFRQRFGPYEAQGLGCILTEVRCEGALLTGDHDFSVVRFSLPRPLAPNDSTEFFMAFKTYFDTGNQRRRMKRFASDGFMHYDGVHWYPRICVYDMRKGWDTDQHLGKEFYGNFGTYDVRLTFASNYVVGATGTLLNAEEVMPDSLRAALDLRRFAHKPWNEPASQILPYRRGHYKTWHFYAENVHDFAFTADPTYRIGETTVTIYDPWIGTTRSVLCQALAQESHAAGWQDAAPFAARLIEIYSRDWGAYIWPKIIVADANDGMEYPMVTLNGGRSPGYYNLLAHEVAHMWFFGHVGNNETYRAFLDEGFTQFLESRAMQEIFGDFIPASIPTTRWQKRIRKPLRVVATRVFHPYLTETVLGIDESINQHSDMFHGALGHGGGYRAVYFKTASMLYHLQYVLGDSLFQSAMKHYFRQWMLCHPYPEDFRQSIRQHVGADMDWFFDQWMETTKKLDYAVQRIRRISDGPALVPDVLLSEGKKPYVSARETPHCYEITLARHGRMQSPIDLRIEARDGTFFDFHIPNTWFVKTTQATLLPRWYGWDKLHPTYMTRLFVPSGVRRVMIDPSFRLPDVYMPDNTRPRPIAWSFDWLTQQPVDWRNYQMVGRPDLWYNAIDGVRIGLRLEGSYMNHVHRFSLSVWGATYVGTQTVPACLYPELGIEDEGTYSANRFFPITLEGSYNTVLPRFVPRSFVDVRIRMLEGLYQLKGTMGLYLFDGDSLIFTQTFVHRPGAYAAYLMRPASWSYGYSSHLTLGYVRPIRSYALAGTWKVMLRTSSFAVQDPFAMIQTQMTGQLPWQRSTLRGRIIGYIGWGKIPLQNRLRLTGASTEEFMDNPWVRSRGWLPASWYCSDSSQLVHFHYGGGLNVRGAIDQAGISGFAVNGEWDVLGFLTNQPSWPSAAVQCNLYPFFDAGVMSTQRLLWQERADQIFAVLDAGVGFSAMVRRWGPFDRLQPFTLRFEFPLMVVSATKRWTPDNVFGLRWLIGMGRSF